MGKGLANCQGKGEGANGREPPLPIARTRLPHAIGSLVNVDEESPPPTTGPPTLGGGT